MSNIFVTTLDPSLLSKIRTDLEEQGFTLTTPAHTHFQAKKPGVSCTLYTTMKLTVQGKNKQEFIEFYLEPEILKSPVYTYKNELLLESIDKRPRIGVDESGKGDYFGPLCVAGIFADEKTFPTLLRLNVRDSKLMTDAEIRKVAPEIVAALPNYIIRLRPQKYNELYASFKNLNTLLAWCHASVIEQIAKHTKPEVAIIDQFAHPYVVEKALAKKKVTLHVEQRVRGEADIVVAAASIVARWAFIEGLEQLGKEFHISLPKGASHAVHTAAKKLIEVAGVAALGSVAKLHFSTTKKISP